MKIDRFEKIVLGWYKKHRRDLPWRNTKNPYKILVSEVMLQQTQILRVLPKYREFLRAFPTLRKLASAPNRKLLKVWAGLGYWKRALSLKQTANKILKEYEGKFPTNPAILKTFPGIGPYTSRALSCFAFGGRDAFLDTNIRRVYLHFFFPSRKNVPDKEILRIAQRAISYISDGRRKHSTDVRKWHYALFDYGASVLKGKSINRRSKHYAKQGRFEGSFRSFRTKVMRFLLGQPKQTAAQSRLRKLLLGAGSPYAPEKILASLEKDGLIKKRASAYSL